ncbi:MAG: cytoplasmic protein [Ahrensia sp.]|nr:cytoplasmic protein [Ahrensia sp.]
MRLKKRPLRPLPLLLLISLIMVPPVLAQSESQQNTTDTESFVVPTPNEITEENEAENGTGEGAEDEAIDEADETDDAERALRGGGPPPEILHDIESLPQPVRRMRELILSAAKSGEIEKLRDLVGIGETATTLSIGGLDGDPIDFLKEASGDDDGYEILAILIEVLEAGYVHLDIDAEEEIYVWPYFFAWPLDGLTPQQSVELYRVLTAGDVEDSRSFGGYVFYRVGIKPDGTWSFFVAGD